MSIDIPFITKEKKKKYCMVYIHKTDGEPIIFYGYAKEIKEIVAKYDLGIFDYAIFDGYCLKGFNGGNFDGG